MAFYFLSERSITIFNQRTIFTKEYDKISAALKDVRDWLWVVPQGRRYEAGRARNVEAGQ